MFSQELDSTLTHLENNLKNANNNSKKVEAMLAIGEYELDHNFSRATIIIPEAYQLIEQNKSTLENDYEASNLV